MNDNKYTAIIIEPRKHAALRFVLNNAIECLPDNWNIILFHGRRNSEYSKNIMNELNAIYTVNNSNGKKNRISLVNLNVDNLNLKTYSELLATKSIIYEYIYTEYFLVFQTDSMIFKKNLYLLDEMINGNYDYIGAPWLGEHVKGNYDYKGADWFIRDFKPSLDRDLIGNGGFSLRKTKKMIEIIEKHKYNENNSDLYEDWPEDFYFTKKYSDIIITKPSYETAKKFSVEEVFSEVTLGCHKPWLTWHYSQFVVFYPECEELRRLQYYEL